MISVAQAISTQDMPNIAMFFMQYGVVGVMLWWFAFRMEKKVEKLIEAMAENTNETRRMNDNVQRLLNNK